MQGGNYLARVRFTFNVVMIVLLSPYTIKGRLNRKKTVWKILQIFSMSKKKISHWKEQNYSLRITNYKEIWLLSRTLTYNTFYLYILIRFNYLQSSIWLLIISTGTKTSSCGPRDAFVDMIRKMTMFSLNTYFLWLTCTFSDHWSSVRIQWIQIDTDKEAKYLNICVV